MLFAVEQDSQILENTEFFFLYIENCLNPIIKEINKQRPISGTTSMKFLHDNARPHITKTVKTHLNEAGFPITCHPPYSPD